MHWARLEVSALGSLIAACPAWKRREEEEYTLSLSTLAVYYDVIDRCHDVTMMLSLLSKIQTVASRDQKRSAAVEVW